METLDRPPNKPNFKLIFIGFLATILAIIVIVLIVLFAGGHDLLPHHALHRDKQPQSQLILPQAPTPPVPPAYSVPV